MCHEEYCVNLPSIDTCRAGALITRLLFFLRAWEGAQLGMIDRLIDRAAPEPVGGLGRTRQSQK
jgi:hypothetical protein